MISYYVNELRWKCATYIENIYKSLQNINCSRLISFSWTPDVKLIAGHLCNKLCPAPFKLRMTWAKIIFQLEFCGK